jgi:alkylation response protein AidB-like acyl-CoA dehydrogenase
MKTDLITTVQTISQTVLRRWAADVDAKNRFPQESIDALREAGLFGYFIPTQYGGLGGDLKTAVKIAALLGEKCLSTALIWGMHLHQVAVLADHAADAQADVLTTIAREGTLVASVTSEPEKGGDLLRAWAPIQPEGNRLRVRRAAPIVSYGAEAGYFLITMRSGEDKPDTDVSLVLVTPEDGEITVTGEWNAMGTRGTRSVPMTFDVLVDPSRIIGKSFREVVMQTMIPAVHIGWTAAWYGGARGAFRRFVSQLRTMGATGKRKLDSDLFLSRLARLRVSLDLLEAMLNQTTERVQSLRQNQATLKEYEDITHNIGLDNLKIAGSELAFSIVDGLIELSNFNQGYLKNEPYGLERVFRDLRSASLQYKNDRLLEANGKLILVEDSPMSAIWR